MTDSSKGSPSGEPKSPSPSQPSKQPLPKASLEIKGLSEMTMHEIVQGLLDARSKARSIESFMESLTPLVADEAEYVVGVAQTMAKDLSAMIYGLYSANARKTFGS